MGVWVWVWVATSAEWHEINTMLCVFVGSRMHTAVGSLTCIRTYMLVTLLLDPTNVCVYGK